VVFAHVPIPGGSLHISTAPNTVTNIPRITTKHYIPLWDFTKTVQGQKDVLEMLSG